MASQWVLIGSYFTFLQLNELQLIKKTEVKFACVDQLSWMKLKLHVSIYCREWSQLGVCLMNPVHWRSDGARHLKEIPSPMGADCFGGFHFDDPPSPIDHRHDILQSSREWYENQVLAGLYEAAEIG